MSEIQKLTFNRMDVETLEAAGETLVRAGCMETAISLLTIALRLRTESGWTAEPSNVIPLRGAENVS